MGAIVNEKMLIETFALESATSPVMELAFLLAARQ
jgi:hypothetical protein